MRFVRTNDSSMLASLRLVTAPLDECWWSLGGSGFSPTRSFVERERLHDRADDPHYARLQGLLGEYVEEHAGIGRVGRPGFFSRLGDTVDFNWSCHFAIAGDTLPLASLRVIQRFSTAWFDPLDALPTDVVLVARDIDGAYQEFGFRDEWMFTTVLHDLRNRGLPSDEVTNWTEGR